MSTHIAPFKRIDFPPVIYPSLDEREAEKASVRSLAEGHIAWQKLKSRTERTPLFDGVELNAPPIRATDHSVSAEDEMSGDDKRAFPTEHLSVKVFAELSAVKLVHDVASVGGHLPKGATGTVVGRYAGGKGYEVEFIKPFHTVATLDVSDLDQ